LLEDWIAVEISKPFYFSEGRFDSPVELFLKWNRRFGRYEPSLGFGPVTNIRVFHSGRQVTEGKPYELSFGLAATTGHAIWLGRQWGLEFEVGYGYLPLGSEVEHELNFAVGTLFAF